MTSVHGGPDRLLASGADCAISAEATLMPRSARWTAAASSCSPARDVACPTRDRGARGARATRSDAEVSLRLGRDDLREAPRPARDRAPPPRACAMIWRKTPCPGPPLWSCPVEWRNRGPKPTVVATRLTVADLEADRLERRLGLRRVVEVRRDREVVARAGSRRAAGSAPPRRPRGRHRRRAGARQPRGCALVRSFASWTLGWSKGLMPRICPGHRRREFPPEHLRAQIQRVLRGSGRPPMCPCSASDAMRAPAAASSCPPCRSGRRSGPSP